MQLTKNFTLDELLKSPTALQWGFEEQFKPSQEVVDNLKELTVHILQPLRDIIGRPIKITSGYRCPRVNAKVGGVSQKVQGKVVQTSSHVLGQAADIEVWVDGLEANGIIIDALHKLMKDSSFEWDQLILEYGSLHNPSWVHISYRKGNNRKQILRKETNKPYVNIQLP